MEIVFGVDYPHKPPRFFWLTPVWHPNIFSPFICNADFAFPMAATLDQIALMTGKMVQYQHYNVEDPLWEPKRRGTVDWVKQKEVEDPAFFPYDRRDLLTGREVSFRRQAQGEQGGFIEWVDEATGTAVAGDVHGLIELI
jgi:hypothetical protein